MLNHTILEPEGILVIKPHTPLGTDDFNRLGDAVDHYLTSHDKLHGVMVHSKRFPGWENFGGFTAHMHFLRAHHQQVERVAVVTDSPFAPIAESLGKHFTGAKLRHFAFAEGSAALQWLKTH